MVVRTTNTGHAWVCDTCGHAELIKAVVTGTGLLFFVAAVAVFASIVNFSDLREWKLPIYGALIVTVAVTVYLIARKAEE